MNNESLFNTTEMLQTFTNNTEQVAGYLIKFAEYILTKYTATFGENHWSAIMLFLIILNSVIQISTTKNYSDYLQDLQDQIHYLKSKIRIQEGNQELVLDRNEFKLTKLLKQMKKLQNEVKKYA